ncbi:MAG: hypothetical protein KGS48_01765, partial [Bacteroidetes bacterium]|nr:hypothetical protein [Bacteroidota bacterium]
LDKQLRNDAPDERLYSKMDAWKAIYGHKKLDEAQLRRVASDLTQLSLQFLALEHRSQNTLQELLELQRILKKPAFKAHLQPLEKQLVQTLENDQAPSAQTYLTGFQAHWNITNRVSASLNVRDFISHLFPADAYLERFYVVQKLKLYIAWHSFRNFRSTEAPFVLPPGFLEYVRHAAFSEEPVIAIYCKVVDCLLEPDESRFFDELIHDLEQRGKFLSKEDLKECYNVAQNYCAVKINQGQTVYHRALFNIFKELIEKDILLVDHQLSEGMYKNVITVALRVEEFAWAEQFVQAYSDYLPNHIRDNAKTYNLANLYSHQKQHTKVIELLRNVEYSDLVYTLSSKLILIRTYYETHEWMALDSLLDSFRIFLRRNKQVPKTSKTEFNNFLGFVKKLSALPLADKKARVQLHEKVAQCNAVVLKKWLLEKILEG